HCPVCHLHLHSFPTRRSSDLIGLDTVERKGKGFAVRVKTGDHVQKGQELIRFDLDDLRKAGYDVTSPVIVTNSDDFLDVVAEREDRKSTRLNSSHVSISYAVF